MKIEDALRTITEMSKLTSLPQEKFWEAMAKLSKSDHILNAALQKNIIDTRDAKPEAACKPIET